MTYRIDLNADLGEGCGDDAGIMAIVTSCNIACGGHAGDAESMKAALGLAQEFGVAAGAHPSYPDRENFGRIDLEISANDLRNSLEDQVGELKQIAQAAGTSLTHLKPHGALYNYAARHTQTAEIIAGITASLLPGSALFGPPGSKLEDAAAKVGIRYLGEAFADRAYEADGSLRSRRLPNAVHEAASGCAAQAVQIVLKNVVTCHDGHRLPMQAQTICLHSDSPGALAAARMVRDILENEGVMIEAAV